MKINSHVIRFATRFEKEAEASCFMTSAQNDWKNEPTCRYSNAFDKNASAITFESLDLDDFLTS